MGATRGRSPGFQMGEEHRTKIRNSKIVSRLISHAEGEVDMSSTQVTAALGLLKKVMPDLAATALTGEDGGPLTVELIRRVIVDSSGHSNS